MTAKKKLVELTPEQDALCDVVAEEYIKDLTVAREPDMGPILAWLDVVYGLFDQKRPARIEIADSPYAALRLASELTGTQETSLEWCGTGDGGWVSFYDYWNRLERPIQLPDGRTIATFEDGIGLGILTDEEAAEILKLRDFGRVAWDSVLLDECAIVICRPIALRVDDEGNLHSATAPCIEWADGEKDYAYHGIWIPERMVLSPRSYTREEFAAIANTEERRALCEINGWDWVASLLKATEADAWTDPDTKLTYHLLRCSDGTQLLEKRSPPLKSGSQPDYIEPVHEDLRTAQAARKWQATGLTVQECEKDPALTYGFEA